MQFYKPAWGVTCLSGFHQVLLWVPAQDFLVYVIGWPLVPCLDPPSKAWKELCACGSFPAKPSMVQGSREQQTNPALHSEPGAHRLKANADDGRAHSPSILDIFLSSALLAALLSSLLLAGVFPRLTDNRSWWAKPFLFRLIPHNSLWRSLVSSSWTPHAGYWKLMFLQSWGHAKHQL